MERDTTDRGAEPDGRKALRQERSAPIITEFRGWPGAEQPRVMPRSPMGAADSYALPNWAALERFPEDGRLDPDNRADERAIRRVAAGRKNWLFRGSDSDGRTTATLIGICASSRRHDIDPWAHMRDVLVRVSVGPASHVRQLLPDRCRLQRDAAPAPPPRAPPG